MARKRIARARTTSRRARRKVPVIAAAQVGVGGAAPAGASSALKGEVIHVAGRIFAGGPQKFAGKKLPVLPDLPDIRDRMYEPALRTLVPVLRPRALPFKPRNQGADFSCTGHALAQLIDLLQASNGGAERVSARMLYEMAKRNDEWTSTAYTGSSLRGALKGFFRNGVCSETLSPDKPLMQGWALTYDMAQDARRNRLGAYYRLRPDINDYHAALNETGAIYVSAQIHTGWDKDSINDGRIVPGGTTVGGHAFVITGYDDKGFFVLNSWGPAWGNGGVAHWTYADWAATIMDAWVLQLAIRAPDAFGVMPSGAGRVKQGPFGFGDPERADILGHFINIDDGQLQLTGKYHSPTPEEMQATVDRFDPNLPGPKKPNDGKGYQHLMIYAHGGLNSGVDEAKRIFAWTKNKIFARNGIYNFHLMWDTDLIEEVFGAMSRDERAGLRAGAGLGDLSDKLLELIAKAPGSRAWRNMKNDAKAAFPDKLGGSFAGGVSGLKPLLEGIAKLGAGVKVHLVGHSAGAVLLGHLLSALKHFKLGQLRFGSVQLMAPACTQIFFEAHYRPYLKGNGVTKIDGVQIYNLTDRLEQDDEVGAALLPWPRYFKSLLYLVSRAFEENPGEPIVGMELTSRNLIKDPKLSVVYGGLHAATSATSHGGFDNDVATMTSIMRGILGAAPPAPPTAAELSGY